ncbi:MAG TPA: hypothetical protein VFB96_14105 [Pirellulaceae bacterium]|nr:hypothetical protein [Pirellulaceae bacterium]
MCSSSCATSAPKHGTSIDSRLRVVRQRMLKRQVERGAAFQSPLGHDLQEERTLLGRQPLPLLPELACRGSSPTFRPRQFIRQLPRLLGITQRIVLR